MSANIDYFAVDWNGTNSEVLRRLKPYAELVLLAGLNRSPEDPALRAVETLTHRWLRCHPPHATKLLEVVLEFPQAFTWVGSIWQFMKRANVPSHGLEKTVRRLCGLNGILYFERDVGQEISIYFILKQLGIRQPFSLGKLHSRTMVNKRAWDVASDTAIYCICHDIFFLTNWGELRLRGRMRPAYEWHGKLQSWYQRCLAAENFDLAAEIFIAMSFLHGGRVSQKFACESARVEDPRLPNPPEGQGAGFNRAGDSEGRQQFYRHYHTIIACMLAMRH